MYRRFLNNADYLGIITEEALSQLIRDKEIRFSQAEEAAEESIIEYLTDNYEVEKCLMVGKNLIPHNPQITYPAGAHFMYNHRIYVTLRPVNGCKAPMLAPYWEIFTDLVEDEKSVKLYSQALDWAPGDLTKIGNTYFKCLTYNGPSFNDIRIPGVDGWTEMGASDWLANVPYGLWAVVKYENKFYTLISIEDVDLTISPDESDNWGLIGDYTPDYEYEFSDHEYVVYHGHVFYPSMNVNSDKLEESYNIKEDDPRNPNIKKHMLRLAIYELHKLISPNNISSARITDYETSITWLRDASRLKINPHIPRKLDECHRPETEYAIATFARDYDPYKNPWQV